MQLSALVRPAVLTQPTYEPGKPIEADARELGLDPAGILKKYRALLNPGGRIIVSMVDNARTRAVWRLIDPVFGIEDAMTTTQGKGTVVTKVMRTD